MPFTNNIKGIEYKDFIDYRTGISSKELPLPSWEYWKTLEDVLRNYVRHDDGKFDYINGIAKRKHITVNSINYIGKETPFLDEVEILGIQGVKDFDISYFNLDNFKTWVMGLFSEDVKDNNINREALYRIQQKIKHKEKINFKTKTVKTLIKIFNNQCKANFTVNY